MGLLARTLASGVAEAANTASGSLDTAIKYAYMNELENAKELRAQNLARLQGDQEMVKEQYKQDQAVAGYVDGRPITNAALQGMTPEDQAKVVNPEAYKSQLRKEEEEAKAGVKFVGQDATGQPWTMANLKDYQKSHNGSLPPGFRTNEQIKNNIDEKNAAANEKKANAYEAKTTGDTANGGEKPLTKAQKLAAGAKALAMTHEAQMKSPTGAISANELSVINEYWDAAGQEPRVPVKKIISPAKDGIFSDTPAVYGYDYVPYSQAQQKPSGLIGSTAQKKAQGTAQKKSGGNYVYNPKTGRFE